MPDLDFSEISGFSFGFSETSSDESISFGVNENTDEININVDTSSEDVAFDAGANTMSVDPEMSGDPTIIGNHKHLSGRALPDQHPMSAITGLTGALTAAGEYADQVSLDALNAAKSYADALKVNILETAQGYVRIQAADDEERFTQIRIDLNGIATEVSAGGSIWTQINQNAHDITLKANQADVTAQFQVQAGQISSKVSTSDFQSYVSQTADTIASIVAGIDGYDPDAVTNIWSAITQTANDIAAEVGRAKGAEQWLSTRIQTADRIIQTVSQNKTVVNLLPRVYRSEEQHGNGWTTNGITFTVNPDGSVTATGTASDDTNAYFYLTSQSLGNDTPPVTVDPLKEYRLSGCPAGGGSNYYMLARCTAPNGTPSSSGGTTYTDEGSSVLIPVGFKYISVYIRIRAGYACPQDGLTFWPMLEVDPGIVVSNLLPSEYRSEDVHGTEWETNGLTFTVSDITHSVMVEGEAASATDYYLTSQSLGNDTPPVTADPEKDYVLYGCPEGGGTDYYLEARCTADGTTPSSSSGTTYRDTGSGIRIPKGYKYIAVYIHVASGVAIGVGGLVFTPVLHSGQPSGYQSSHEGTHAIYSKIEQTADGIMSEVADISDDVSSISTWMQSPSGFISEVKSVVNNVQIGARNLLLKSATKKLSAYGSPDITYQEGVMVSEWNCDDAIRAYGSSGSYSTFGRLLGTSEKDSTAVNNQSYVFSVWVKNNRAFTPLFISNGLGGSEMLSGGASKRVVLTGTGDGSSKLRIYFATNSAGDSFDVTWWHPKIERGGIVSDWSPAPEDLESVVSENVSYITQLNNKIALVVAERQDGYVVNAASIVAQINDSGSSVVIDADHVSLSGKTIDLTSDNIAISSTNFSVTSAGVVTATGANISGQITASSGAIGGWDILSNRLEKDMTGSGGYRSGMRNSSTSGAVFYAGTNTAAGGSISSESASTFYVTDAGYLYAANAKIKGRIEAASGVIGTGATNKINIGTDASHASIYNGKSSLNDTASNGFYLGTDGLALGKGKFKVTSAGALTATEAMISGTISAFDGNVGGWNILSTRLSKDLISYDAETDVTTTYRAGLQGNPSSFTENSSAFYIKKTVDGSDSYPFTVSYGGKLTATDANITGIIKAKSGQIGSGATNKIVIGSDSTNASIYYGVTGLSDIAHNGFYIGTDGIAVGKGKFKVTNAGVLTATEASISGTITASGGSIAGWTVDDEKIYKDVDAGNGVTYSARMRAPASANTGHRAFYVVKYLNDQVDDFPFSVNYAGKLTAKGVDISGEITATSGSIAGWTIGSNVITKEVTGSDTYTYGLRLYAGNDVTTDTRAINIRRSKTGEANKFPFHVTYGGHLHAEDADIGGWSVDSEKIYKDVDAGNGVTYSARMRAPSNPGTSNRAFYVVKQQSGQQDEFPFSVTYGGKLTATGVDITGKITATSGSISGSLVSSGIDAANITTGYLAAARIEAGAITSGKIASGAITTAKLDADAVTAAKIATGAVEADAIAAGAVTTAKLDALAVTSAKIAAGAITTAKLDAEAVTAAKIAANTITAAQIAANTITAGQIAANTITANEIAANAITVGKIKAGEITADRINVGQNGGSGADARKIEWLTQINLAVSMAVNESSYFRLGNWQAYGTANTLAFGTSGRWVRFTPAGYTVYAYGHGPGTTLPQQYIAWMLMYCGNNVYRALIENGSIIQIEYPD